MPLSTLFRRRDPAQEPALDGDFPEARGRSDRAAVDERWTPYLERGEEITWAFQGSDHVLYVDRLTGHSQFRPTPSTEALTTHYNGGFAGGENHAYNLDHTYEGVVAAAGGVRDYLREVAGFAETFAHHDVGCAFGALVYGFQQLGCRSTGDEPNAAWVRAGNDRCGGALTSAPLAAALAARGEPIDLFTATHVLEHLPDPVAALKTMADHLSPEGVVYLCTPNAACAQYVFGGRRKDPYFTFPDHLQYFTPASMLAMARDAGLEGLHLETRWQHGLLHGDDYVYEQAFGTTKAEAADGGALEQALNRMWLGQELFLLCAKRSNTRARRLTDFGRRIPSVRAVADPARPDATRAWRIES